MVDSLPISFDPAALAPSTAALARSTGAGAAPKLAKAAVDFESVLLGQWLQSAEKSFGTVPGSEEDEDAGGDQMLSFATQQLAQSIAARGGLGIGKIVERALEKSPQAGSADPSR